MPQNSHSIALKESGPGKKVSNVNYCIVCHEIKSEIDLIHSTKITSVYKIDSLSQDSNNNNNQDTPINTFEKSMCIVDSVYNNDSNSKINKNKKIELKDSKILDKLIVSNLFIMPSITNPNDNSIMFSYLNQY